MNVKSINEVPRLLLLPRIYRLMLTLTRRHGLFTLARLHHRHFRDGQVVALPGGSWLFIPGGAHYFGFLSGMHEAHVQDTIEQHVRPGDVCLDVGANIGFFAMMMAHRAGATGKVYAFEPVPETFEVLSQNAQLARASTLNLMPIHAAVSSSNGELSICRHAHSTLNQVFALGESSAKASERVAATTLVSALEKLACEAPISLLKIDVEGHELSVLQGAERLMASGRIRRMIIEVSPGNDAAVIAQMLSDCQATVRCWLQGRWEPIALGQLLSRTDVLAEFSL